MSHSADVRINIASLDKQPMVALRDAARAAGVECETEETTHSKQGDPDYGKTVWIVRLKGGGGQLVRHSSTGVCDGCTRRASMWSRDGSAVVGDVAALRRQLEPQ